jgi:DnaD/phage-associated family protein
VIVDRPNIFALYEQNIGPLTPMLADLLRDAEATYPADWIADAMKIAVENNKRNWRYVEAILKSWATEGRGNARRKNDRREDVNPYLRDDYFRRRESDEEES